MTTHSNSAHIPSVSEMEMLKAELAGVKGQLRGIESVLASINKILLSDQNDTARRFSAAVREAEASA